MNKEDDVKDISETINANRAAAEEFMAQSDIPSALSDRGDAPLIDLGAAEAIRFPASEDNKPEDDEPDPDEPEVDEPSAPDEDTPLVSPDAPETGSLRLRCERYPSLTVVVEGRGLINFADGVYETSDPVEIEVLGRIPEVVVEGPA